MNNDAVIVTGGAGAIGSYLVESLLKLGFEVTVVDNLISGKVDNLPSSEKLHFFQMDIRDEALETLYTQIRPRVIYHLAAHYANELSIKEPVEDLDVNAKGTLLQLQIAKKIGVDRFVYASSSCVYASSSDALREDSKLAPHTPYGISKLIGEEYCNFFSSYYGLPVTILRYFNSYGGKEFSNPFRGVVPRFIENALSGVPLPITGSGNEYRDFTYVEDTVKGTILSSLSDKGKNETFNIGTGEITTISKLANTIVKVTASQSKIEYMEGRTWDKTNTRMANINKIRNLLGFNPTYDLTEGLKKTVEWYKTIF